MVHFFEGRHAEKRAPEIKRLRDAAGGDAYGSREKAWALLVLPQPLASKVQRVDYLFCC